MTTSSSISVKALRLSISALRLAMRMDLSSLPEYSIYGASNQEEDSESAFPSVITRISYVVYRKGDVGNSLTRIKEFPYCSNIRH